MPFPGKRLTKEQALQKLRHFCGYQERCHSEVREKLASLGIWKTDAEELAATLIEENYLNEERFASSYARGRFSLKQWGRIKIRYALAQKGISDYCIKKALLEINEDDYLETLGNQAAKKWATLADEKNPLTRTQKCFEFLQQKGFESALIQAALRKLRDSPGQQE